MEPFSALPALGRSHGLRELYWEVGALLLQADRGSSRAEASRARDAAVALYTAGWRGKLVLAQVNEWHSRLGCRQLLRPLETLRLVAGVRLSMPLGAGAPRQAARAGGRS